MLTHLCLCQVTQKRRARNPPSLDPVVLSVFAPPFVRGEDGQQAAAGFGTLSKTKRLSLRKKREKPRAEPCKDLPGGPRGLDAEDVCVPNGVDLLALPQLCFPGASSRRTAEGHAVVCV